MTFTAYTWSARSSRVWIGVGVNSAEDAIQVTRPGRVTIELRRCGERRCRWVSLARRSVAIAAGKANVTVRSRRFVRGSYRATAVLSSSLGSGTPVRDFFRIR